MPDVKLHISDKKLAWHGAAAAVAAVFAYSLLVMVYVLVRSAASIWSIMPKGGRMEILWANGISVAYTVAVFSLIIAALSAIPGAVAAVILKKLLLYFNPRFNFKNAIVIGSVMAMVLLILLYLFLYFLLKKRMTFKYAATFLFWFFFPGVIFFFVAVTGGGKLNAIMGKSGVKPDVNKDMAAKTN
jgi:hypothetical protein